MLSVGMTKDEIMNKFGTFSCNWLINPWKIEPLYSKGSSKYEVVYYVIKKKLPFQSVKAKNLTPLVFKDGKLIGWGNIYLRDIRYKIQ